MRSLVQEGGGMNESLNANQNINSTSRMIMSYIPEREEDPSFRDTFKVPQ